MVKPYNISVVQYITFMISFYYIYVEYDIYDQFLLLSWFLLHLRVVQFSINGSLCNKNNNNSTATMILYLESGPDRASLYVNITALYLHTEIVCYSALKEY